MDLGQRSTFSLPNLIQQGLRDCCQGLKLIVLSGHDEPSVRRAAMEAGTDGFVLKRDISTDLMLTAEYVLADDGGTPSANVN